MLKKLDKFSFYFKFLFGTLVIAFFILLFITPNKLNLFSEKVTGNLSAYAGSNCDPNGGPNGGPNGAPGDNPATPPGGGGGPSSPDSPGIGDPKTGDIVYNIDFSKKTDSKVDNCGGGTTALYTKTIPALPFDMIATFVGGVDDTLIWNGKVVGAGKGIVDGQGKTCDAGLVGGSYAAPLKKGQTLTIGVGDTYGVNVGIKGTLTLRRPKSCAVIAYNGFGNDPGFSNAVREKVNTFIANNPMVNLDTYVGVRTSTFSFDDAVVSGNAIQGDIENAKKDNPAANLKILSVSHSIAAIGVYNKYAASGGQGKLFGADVIFYDPPYNFDKSIIGTLITKFTWLVSFGSDSNLAQIKLARQNGVASDTSVVTWTDGFKNTVLNFLQISSAHTTYDGHLDGIDSWLNANCK